MLSLVIFAAAFIALVGAGCITLYRAGQRRLAVARARPRNDRSTIWLLLAPFVIGGAGAVLAVLANLTGGPTGRGAGDPLASGIVGIAVGLVFAAGRWSRRTLSPQSRRPVLRHQVQETPSPIDVRTSHVTVGAALILVAAVILVLSCLLLLGVGLELEGSGVPRGDGLPTGFLAGFALLALPASVLLIRYGAWLADTPGPSWRRPRNRVLIAPAAHRETDHPAEPHMPARNHR